MLRLRDTIASYRFPAKRERLTRFQGRLRESQGQNLAVTVLYVPYLLDSRTLRSTGVRTGAAPPIHTLSHQTLTLRHTLSDTHTLDTQSLSAHTHWQHTLSLNTNTHSTHTRSTGVRAGAAAPRHARVRRNHGTLPCGECVCLTLSLSHSLSLSLSRSHTLSLSLILSLSHSLTLSPFLTHARSQQACVLVLRLRDTLASVTIAFALSQQTHTL